MILIVSLCHFIDVFFFYNKELTKKIVTENKALFSVAVVILIAAVILVTLDTDISICGAAFLVSVVLIFVDFYMNRHKHRKEHSLDDYYNPMGLLTCILAVYFLVQSGGMFLNQTSLICKGVSTKELDSINKKEIEMNNKKIELDKKYVKQCSCSKGIKNIFTLIFSRTEESLINKRNLKEIG